MAFIFFTSMANYILYDDSIYYRTFAETLGVDRITEIIERQKLFQKIGMGFIPILLLIRSFYTSICLGTGALVSSVQLNYGQCFNIALKADIIFLFELFIKINYFSVIGVNSIQELNIHLFSVLQWLRINNIEQWLFFPLGVLNVFELIYWVLLSLFISYYTQKSFWNSLGFVMKTYGCGLLLLIIFVIYITLYLF